MSNNPPPDVMMTRAEIMSVANEKGLLMAVREYASWVSRAPGKRTRTNGYNSYTPQGQMSVPNPNWRKQLTVWKNEKLFPYFLGLGFTKIQINEAYKQWKAIHRNIKYETRRN